MMGVFNVYAQELVTLTITAETEEEAKEMMLEYLEENVACLDWLIEASEVTDEEDTKCAEQ